MKKNKSQLKIGIILGYVNVVFGNLIPFFYTPIMLRLLTEEEHGLYKLANSTASYLSLAALGIGAAVTRYLIKARTEEGEEAEQKMFGMFNIIFGVISVFTLLIGTILAFNLDIFYGDSLAPQDLKKMTILVLLLTVNTALGFSASAYTALVSSHEKFVFLQTINLLTTCVSPIVNLVVLFLGYASIGMVSSTLAISVVIRIIYFAYVRFVLKIHPQYKDLPTKVLKDIMHFSFWIFVGTIVDQLYSATDSVIIGAIPGLGAAAVSIYSVGTVFSHIISSLSTTVSTLLSPKTNKMVFAKASREELSNYAIRIGRYQAFIVFLAVSGFIALGGPFVKFYAGDAYIEAYNVAILIMIPLCIPLVQNVALSITVAEGKHKFRALTYLFIAVINVIGSYILLKYTKLGITGAALVTGIAYIIGPGFLMNWFYAKKLKLDVLSFWKNMVDLLVIPLSLCTCTLFVSRYVDFSKIPLFLTAVVVYICLYCSLSWIFTMKKEEKELVISPIKSIIRKFKKADTNPSEIQ